MDIRGGFDDKSECIDYYDMCCNVESVLSPTPRPLIFQLQEEQLNDMVQNQESNSKECNNGRGEYVPYYIVISNVCFSTQNIHM
jgi:hypothetical protein